MKNIILYSTILMLLLSKIINAQSTAQTFPIINLSIAPGYDRAIEDFYGLNGQNTLSATSMYANTNVNSGLAASYASYLRYPGGTVANYWDWQEGWFFRNMEKNGALSLDIDLQNKDRLQDVFNTGSGLLNENGSNYINDFINTLGNTGTKPLFVVNPLTSDLQYQIAMLLEAKLQNLEVKRVEIGNEFYLSNIGYQERFATAQDYANLTTTWRNEIRNYLGNDMQICAVGSNNDYTGSTNNRRDTWNTNLFNSISGSLPEAFSIHHYRNALPPSTTFSSQTFFKKAIDDFNELNNYIYQFGGSTLNTTPIWLTEYNLFDREIPIHGKWYHGLYTAFNTLKFLENNRIKVCNLHAQSGNYTFGNFFNTTDGLKKIGAFDACSASVPTALYGKTSEGIAMEQIAIALKDAEQGKRIGFNAVNGATIPTLNLPPNAEQALYGWVFDKYLVTNNSAIILNLSGSSVNKVNVDQLGFNTQDISIQLSLSNPDYYATGFSRLNGSTTEYEFLTCGSTSNTFANSMSFAPVNIPSSKLISLPPYSITRLEKINNQRLYLYALNDTVKAGSKVIVSLLNKDTIPYTWPDGNDSLPYFEFVAVADTTINLIYTTPGSLTTSIESKFIKVIQSPVIVSITSTSPITNNSIDYCPGNTPIQLTASVTGGSPTNYKYIWIATPTNDEFPDFNKGVGNTATINVSPDYPTKYTVYVTDGVTVAKQLITINVPTAFNLEPSYTSCYNTDIEVEIAKNAYSGVTYSYTWQGINSTIIGNPVKFTISQPNASLSNVVTVTATTSGCTNAKTATVNFYNCCNTSSSLQIEPGSDINDLFDFFDSNNTLFTTGKNSDGQLKVTSLGAANSTHFIVNGDLHLRDDAGSGVFYTGLELINANVTFTEGASITVEPGFSLTLNNSNLDAECDEMWKGIILDAGRFTSTADPSNNSSIKNAEVAVNSFPGSNLNIRRTILENNIIGIEADHQSADGDNLQFFNIRANEFRKDVTAALKAPYVGQPLPVGTFPLAGIKLDQVAAAIGNPNAISNLFSNLNCGIIAYRSALNITNANFIDIHQDYAYSPLNENIGAGIFSTPKFYSGYSGLTVDGYFIRGTQQFGYENCDYGILTDETDVLVYGTSMDNVRSGISINNNIISKTIIKENNIAAFESCIDLIGNDLSPYIDVQHNTLTTTNQNQSSFAHAIRIYEMNQRRKNDGSNFNLRCNFINMNFAENGIHLLNADYVNLIENVVFQNNQDIYQYAFNTTNSNFCFFDRNAAMLDLNNPFSINNGFLFANSTNNKIVGNSVKNTRLGFEFLGGCGSTDFTQNNMENHFLGLYLNDLTIIDDQIDKGNRWFNLPFGILGAQNDAWNSFPNSSIFKVNPSQGTEFDPLTPNLNWFRQSSNLAPVSGPTQSDCSIGERSIPFNVGESDQLTMQRVAFDSVFYDESLTNASKLLYEKFSLYDSVLYLSPLYVNYVDSLKTKSSGKLSTTRLKLGDKSIYSNGFNFESDQLALNTTLDSLLVSDSTNIVNFTLQAYNAFKKLNVTSKLFSQDLKYYLDQVKIENNSITPLAIVNENEKNINSILVAHYLKTNANFTLDERNRIESIAYQCPREGGASVYRARTLMNAINPHAVYNDDVQCNAIFARKGRVQKTNEQQLFFKPNKLGNELKFESNVNLEGDFQIKVFDVLGKELLESRIQVNSSTFTLPFNFAENSIYFISVASNNLLSFNFKLIW